MPHRLVARYNNYVSKVKFKINSFPSTPSRLILGTAVQLHSLSNCALSERIPVSA
jgi:hypothetical protein